MVPAVMTLALWALLAPSWAGWGGSLPPESGIAKDGISLEAANALEAKFRALLNPDPGSSPSFQPIVITEEEANSYLKYRGLEFLPPGVHDAELHIKSDLVSGTANVDFAELNQAGTNADNLFARFLASVLSGKQRVSGSGRLETGNGRAQLKIEKVMLGTVEVPEWLVNWMAANYVQKRYDIDLSKPFLLPDHVTRIELSDGRATLLRRPEGKK